MPVHSGSVPPDLLESALFGHVKGAFTGALTSRKGYFEIANHGTIFFDEIGTISAGDADQAAARDPGARVHAAGLGRNHPVDVRIVAATNADLKKLVEEGKFREDLYYRLNVINLALPPLRDRKEDIPAAGGALLHQILPRKREVSGSNDNSLAPDFRAGRHADPDGPRLAGQRPGAGERGRARGGAGVASRPFRWTCCRSICSKPAGCASGATRAAALPADASLFEIVADFERRKIIEQLEASDWSQTVGGRGAANSALDAESEDQAAEHRDQAEGRGGAV